MTSWTDQWLYTQQQLAKNWSKLANTSQTDSKTSNFWTDSLNLWNSMSEAPPSTDLQDVMEKCFSVTRNYLSMFEQFSDAIANQPSPANAFEQWSKQLQDNLQQAIDGLSDNFHPWMTASPFNPMSEWQRMMHFPSTTTPQHLLLLDKLTPLFLTWRSRHFWIHY